MNCKHCYGLGYDASGQRCTCQEPARPAKVGRRYPRHPKSVPWSPWRRYLKDLARAMLLVIAVMFVSAITVALLVRKPAARTIDCGMAEWHPDLIQYREACRKVRHA